MFKAGRWRSEKNKIKTLFKLQFHATGVEQVSGDSLVISIIPADVGKSTVRSEKAVIKEGNCYWEKPILESLRLFTDPRTGKFQEKIYYFVVANGWSKADFVGEVSIDFATYADSYKVSSVSLPLKNSKCDALLHVSIQRVQEDVDQREIEEIESATNTPSNERISRARLNNNDVDEQIKGEYTCVPNSPLYDEIPEIRRTNRESCGSDLTMSSSEGSYGLDPTSVLPTIDTSQSKTATSAPSEDVAATDKAALEPAPLLSSLPTTGAELSNPAQSGADMSAFPEYEPFSSPPRDVFPDEKLINELRAEISTLHRKAEVAELELQTLRKSIAKESRKGQDLLREVNSLKAEKNTIVKESRKGQDLLREVNSLKAEKNTLRIECEKAKARNKFEKGDPRVLIEELRQELSYEKERNSNLRVQIMKMQESNSELILAIQELDEMLEQKDNELLNLSNSLKAETRDEEESKIEDLCNEIKIHKREKEELEGHIEQLVLDYEILKQENHDLLHQLEQNKAQAHVEKLENELKEQSSKFSESLATITVLEEHAKSLLEDSEKQAQGFEDDIEILTREKFELEKRAITAEENYRKTRWQNANNAEKIHEEFRRLSVEMSSTLDSNEKFTKKALFQASELRMQKSHLEDLLKKSKEELHFLKDQLSSKVNCIEQLENEKTHGEEIKENLLNEILIHKEEIETLKMESNTRKSDFDQMNASMRETELALEKEKAENLERERETIHLREEVQQLFNELNSLRKEKAENEITIHSLKEQYEANLNELSHKLISKVNYVEELENEKTRGEETKVNLSNEILILKAEIETLKTENNTRKSDFDQMNASMRETELALEKEKAENLERERENFHLREEVQKLFNELDILRKEKAEKEITIHSLKEQYEANLNELSHKLISKVNYIEELETEKTRGEETKANLSNEILTLKADIETLKTKNNSLSVEAEEKQSLKNEFEQMNASMREMELTLEEEKAVNIERERGITRLREEVNELVNELYSMREEKGEKEITFEYVKSELKILKNQHGELKKLFSVNELEKNNLKKKMNSLEDQIKMKEDDFEKLTNSYSEKEKYFQKKMEELEKKRLEDSSAQKMDENNDAISSELRESPLREIVLLKERNKEMENELKEMQDRYSEISLKLAEIEGSRQQLMMRVRNLKNAKK